MLWFISMLYLCYCFAGQRCPAGCSAVPGQRAGGSWMQCRKAVLRVPPSCDLRARAHAEAVRTLTGIQAKKKTNIECNVLCASLRYTTLRYATLHYATLRYATLRYATLRYAMLCRAVLCYAMLRYAILFQTILYYAMLC